MPPPLFPWFTTTGQCWPEVLRPKLNVAWPPRAEGPKFGRKLTYNNVLCYNASCEGVTGRKRVVLGVKLRKRGSKHRFRTTAAKAAA
jgi:hypothetical protein